MNIIVVGLNHKTVPVEIREQYAIPKEEISSILDSFIGDGKIREVVLLSTCNRVEFYILCPEIQIAVEMVFDFFKRRINEKYFKRNLFYVHSQPASIQHLYEVCAGLDSMVVGETEIFGQVKEAYQAAQQVHRTGLTFNKLFQNAFSITKEIRSTTRIGMGSVSVGSVAVDLACQIFNDLNDRTLLLLGAGKMGEATARFLKSRGAQSIWIANRSFEKAENLAKIFKGRAIDWKEWKDFSHQTDIIITSTSASHVILRQTDLEILLQKRNGRPLFLIDIAVPRNIARAVGQLEGVYLYDIDDLQIIAEQNLAKRQQEVASCKQMIRHYTDQFQAWFTSHLPQIAMCPTARKLEGWKRNLESGLMTT